MEAREAATVMLVRDRPGLEVFLLRRNLRSVFVAGAYVFPGGAVDDDDASPAVVDLVEPTDVELADARLGTRGAVRFTIAAIRESFEEAGVLLARDASTGQPVVVDGEHDATLETDRRAVLAGDRTLADVLRARALVPDAGALQPVGRWITPPGAPRRYDTWFFVAPAPEGHAYTQDDDETVDAMWITPLDALARARDGSVELIYPTFRSLEMLAAFDSADALLDAVQTVWRDHPAPLRREHRGEAWMLATGPHQAVDDAMANSTTTHGRRGA